MHCCYPNESEENKYPEQNYENEGGEEEEEEESYEKINKKSKEEIEELEKEAKKNYEVDMTEDLNEDSEQNKQKEGGDYVEEIFNELEEVYYLTTFLDDDELLKLKKKIEELKNINLIKAYIEDEIL